MIQEYASIRVNIVAVVVYPEPGSGLETITIEFAVEGQYLWDG